MDAAQSWNLCAHGQAYWAAGRQAHLCAKQALFIEPCWKSSIERSASATAAHHLGSSLTGMHCCGHAASADCCVAPRRLPVPGMWPKAALGLRIRLARQSRHSVCCIRCAQVRMHDMLLRSRHQRIMESVWLYQDRAPTLCWSGLHLLSYRRLVGILRLAHVGCAAGQRLMCCNAWLLQLT